MLNWLKVPRRLRRLVFLPYMRQPRPIRHSLPLTLLGSPHGAKTVPDLPVFEGVQILSGGLGEDMSFDVEWVRRFGGNVVLVDPTERARRHFDAVMSRAGKPSLQAYSSSGSQDPENYDMRGISQASFSLVPRALAGDVQKEVFLQAPRRSGGISYGREGLWLSSSSGESVTVPSIGFTKLLEDYPAGFDLVKLDIEGFAHEVAADICRSTTRPRFIHLEVEEFRHPTPSNIGRANRTLRMLRDAGFKCVWRGGIEYLLGDQYDSALRQEMA